MRKHLALVLLMMLTVISLPAQTSTAQSPVQCEARWEFPADWFCEGCVIINRVDRAGYLYTFYWNGTGWEYVVRRANGDYLGLYDVSGYAELQNHRMDFVPVSLDTFLFFDRSEWAMYRYHRSPDGASVERLTDAFSCLNLVSTLPSAPGHDIMLAGEGDVALFCDFSRLPADSTLDDSWRGVYRLNTYNLLDDSTTELVAMLTRIGASSWVRAIGGLDGRIYLQTTQYHLHTYPDAVPLVSVDEMNVDDTLILSRDLESDDWTVLAIPQEVITTWYGSPAGNGDELMDVDGAGNLYFYNILRDGDDRDYRLTSVNSQGEVNWQITQDDLAVGYFRWLAAAEDSFLIEVADTASGPLNIIQECRIEPQVP